MFDAKLIIGVAFDCENPLTPNARANNKIVIFFIVNLF
jgi:hypothetical protein